MWRLMIKQGIPEAQARASPHAHIIERGLGVELPQLTEGPVELGSPWALVPGDRVVLCSMRVIEQLGPQRIAELSMAHDDVACVETLLTETWLKKQFVECAAAVLRYGA